VFPICVPLRVKISIYFCGDFGFIIFTFHSEKSIVVGRGKPECLKNPQFPWERRMVEAVRSLIYIMMILGLTNGRWGHTPTALHLIGSNPIIITKKFNFPKEENGMSLSRTEFIGRLTKDPEVKTIQINGQETQVANFTVAVDEDFGEGTDFYDVVAWRQLADNVGKFLGKGRLVYVEGRTKQRTYPITKDGVEFTGRAIEVRANKVQFLDKAGDTGQGGQTQAPAQNTAPANNGPAPF
jgi:single-strand DNA-binding protein